MNRIVFFLILYFISWPFYAQETEPRIIEFAGYEWIVKDRKTPSGPGGNLFNSGEESVWVDSTGALHLKIIRVKNHWECAEIYSKDYFDRGKFLFQCNSRIDRLDANVVLGMFTYSEKSLDGKREIDVEISRWGNQSGFNAQYAIHNPDCKNCVYPFVLSQSGNHTSHYFIWAKDFILFKSHHGHTADDPGNIVYPISSWYSLNKKVPSPRKNRVHINLWLYRSSSPSDFKEVEVIVKSFTFTPLKKIGS